MQILALVFLLLFIFAAVALFFVHRQCRIRERGSRIFYRRTSSLLVTVDAKSLIILNASGSWLELVGLHPNDISFHHLDEIIHPDDKDFFQQEVDRANAKGSKDDLERGSFEHLQIRLKDARCGWRWFEATGFVFQMQKRHLALCCNFILVDDLMRTSKDLQDCRFQLDVQLRNTFDIVWTMNCTSRQLVLLTDVSYKQFGVDDHKAGLIESNEACFVHEDLMGFRKMLNRRIEALMKNGRSVDDPENFPIRVRNQDGSLAWMMTRSSMHKDEVGTFNLFGVSRRINVSDSLKFNDADDFFAAMISLSNVSVFWMDAEHRILGCNNAFASDMGYPQPQDVIGKTDADLAGNETWQAFQKDLNDAYSLRLPISQKIIRYKTLRGENAFAVYNVIPFSNAADGSLRQIFGIYVVVTEEIVQKYLKSGAPASQN